MASRARNERSEPPTATILMYGPKEAGKTRILCSFFNQPFDSYDHSIEDTWVKQDIIDGQTVLYRVWDWYESFEEPSFDPKTLLQEPSSLMLVFSITHRESFDQIPNFRQNIFKRIGVDSLPTILVGNKSDMELEREVSSIDAEQLADSWSCTYLEVSSVDHTNIAEAFRTLAREACKDTLIPQLSTQPNAKAKSLQKCCVM